MMSSNDGDSEASNDGETKAFNDGETGASKSCSGCDDKFDGTAKINFQCGCEYCIKCTDKIILKSNSNDPKCSKCTPDIEEGVVEQCSGCIECSECCKSCGRFTSAFFSCSSGIDPDFMGTCAVLFSIGSFVFSISAIVFGIVRFLEYDYGSNVYTFMIMSVTYNAIFSAIVFRTFDMLCSGIVEDEHLKGKTWIFFILALIHVFLVIFGSYNLLHYFDHNKPVIVLVASSCANIVPSLFLMVA